MKGDSPIRDAHRRASLQRLNRCARFLYALLLAAAAPATAYAQDNPARVTVSGRVTNETTGEPVPGVTVYHEPSRTGTVTNAAGSYTISVPRNATLQFSSIGFAARNVQVPAASGVINVVLAQSAVNLEELVVTGMASTIKRRNLANAVATVSAKDIIGTTRQETVDAALNGKIAGVNIRSITGAPGGGVNMQFRGVSTLGAGSSQPLYIIDGVRVDNSSIGSGRTAMLVGGGTGTATRNDNVANRMADINPEDIESIEVLKGPSAAAIYGARANAGVVIITTKRGAPGRTSISMSQDLGFASALRYLGFDDWSEQKIDLIFTDPARNALEKQRFREGQRYDFEDLIYGEKGLLSNTQGSAAARSGRTSITSSTSE
jgi:TonB-dependent SusC/RagA subfamily outer membrane receptor